MRSSLEIYELAGGTVRVVMQTDLRIEAPNWDPAGDSLLINADGQLFRVALSESEAAPAMRPVDTGAAVRCNNDHGISPDGETIVLSSHHGGKGSEIYLMPVAGGELRKVSPQAPSWWHGWSPDGARLAYVAARGAGPIDVYTLPIAGGPELRLTQGEGHCDGPDYSADCSQIYYNCDRDGHAQIWVMAADGTNQRKLFADEYVNWFPHPSPSGRHLLYLAYPPGTAGHPADLAVALCLCDPDGRNVQRVLAFVGGQGTINVPCWRPDGGAFAYVRYG